MTSVNSPLKQVEKGELRPKVLDLYDQLFKEQHVKDGSYWNEFFLLPCNAQALAETLEPMGPEQMLQQKHITRQLFQQAVDHLYSRDLTVVDNTLVVLMVFFQNVYTKPFVNYSSDVIDVLVGLKKVDVRFDALLEAFSLVIMNAPPLHTRVSAIRTAAVVAGGAFQTSLGNYFTHKDMLFKAIMKFIHDSGTDMYVGDAFSLVGILASFDKMESLNPYRVRLADFVDDKTMAKIVNACGNTWTICLATFTQEFEQSPAASTLSLVPGWLFGRQTEPQKVVDPHGTISLMLAVFEFINVNKVFARLFVESEQFVQFITLCSWLYQTQHKSVKAQTYSRISLMILRIIIEENGPVTRILVEEEKAVIPICQLKTLSTYVAIPPVKTNRALVEGVLDALQCALRFNTKRTMDYDMYELALTTLFQILAYLRSNRVRVAYHWDELWRTLLSLLKFLNTKGPEAAPVARLVALVLSTSLIHGDTILPDSKQYDDLFYKLVGAANDVAKFETVFEQKKTPAIGVLSAACNHYKQLLSDQQSKLKGKTLSAAEVSQVIKQGYNTLSLHQYASSGATNNDTAYLLYDSMPRFKEADERLFLKSDADSN